MLHWCHSLLKNCPPLIHTYSGHLLFLSLTISLLHFNRFTCLISKLKNAGEDTRSQSCECDTCTVTTLCHVASVTANSDSNHVWMLCLGDKAKVWGSQLRAPASFEYGNTALWTLRQTEQNLHEWLHLIRHMSDVIRAMRCSPVWYSAQSHQLKHLCNLWLYEWCAKATIEADSPITIWVIPVLLSDFYFVSH